jgi:hypothetical protein
MDLESDQLIELKRLSFLPRDNKLAAQIQESVN